MGFLKSKNRPTNLQYKWVTDTYKPAAMQSMQAGHSGLNTFMGALTGTDGGAGLDAYKRSTGYENIFGEAMRGVTANRAASGMLASGSLLRRSQDQAAQLAQQNFANWLGQILQGSQLNLNQGNQYANLVAEVGSQRTRTGGLKQVMGTVGDVASAAGKILPAIGSVFSDSRLKEDIELLERRSDGLGVYQYRYKGDDKTHVGVLAQEVARLRPEALGPVVAGYMTVDYSKLPDVVRV